MANSLLKKAWRLASVMAAVLAVVAMLTVLSGCQQEEPKQEEEPAIEVTDTPEPEGSVEYVVVVGDDSWQEYTPGHSDLLMLVRVDTANGVITEVSIPRDTAYTDDDGNKMKINYVFQNGGAEAACEAVSDVTGVNVDQYVVVGFDGLQSIVEHFGGVEVNVPYDVTYHFYTNDYPDETYTAGEQTLDPWRTMALTRSRTGYTQYGLYEDMMRQVVNRQILTTMIDYLVYDQEDPQATVEMLYPFVSTNISVDDLKQWVGLLSSAESITVYGTSGPVDGGIDAETQLWLATYDPQKWSALMSVVTEGGDPSTVNIQTVKQSGHAPINSTTVLTK